MTADHSRGMLLAEGATGRQRDKLERALEESRVAVSLDPEMPESMLTARVLLTTLRRGPGQLLLERSGLPASAADELAAVVDAVDPARPLTVVNNAGGTLAVRLHVGADAGSAVRVVPEGYGAHRPGNPVGAVYAAALGAAEAFKRTARVLPRRRELHRHLRFCPVTLSSDLAAAPDLPAELLLDLALVGVGAIGTGIVLLLDAVGAAGRVLAVDYQRFGPENIGTYSLGGAAEVQAAPWKTDMARAALSRFDVIPFREPADRLPAAMDARVVPWFPLVLTALDTAAARRDAQRLWPDRLIDAATGDTMLGIHDHEHGNGPCMICFFPPDRSGESAAQRLAAATGLPLERTMRGTDPLTETDLVNLRPEQRHILRPHVGTPVCGLAQAVGLTRLGATAYQPSIPFISLQAACLSVGRLIAARLGITQAGNLAQYDGLFGPQAATIECMPQDPACLCASRAWTIDRVRKIRKG